MIGALDVEWKDNMSKVNFNSQFLQLMKRCRNCKLFENGIDQRTLYYAKLCKSRNENTCIYTALTELEKLSDESLLDGATSTVAQIILRKNSDGKVPHDRVEFVGFSQQNGQVLDHQLHNATFCYGCAGQFLHSASCPHKATVCTHCSKKDMINDFVYNGCWKKKFKEMSQQFTLARLRASEIQIRSLSLHQLVSTLIVLQH